MENLKKHVKLALGFIVIIVAYFLSFSNYYNEIKNIPYRESKNEIKSDNFVKQFSIQSQPTYAKVKKNCMLFKTEDVSSVSFININFIVPETYFVLIIDKVNDDVLKVQYKSKIGYVAIDTVEIVDIIPIEPWLEDITFDIKLNVGTQLRSLPYADENNNIKTIIPAGAKNIKYIANVNGTIPSGGTSSIWYYCQYSPSADPTSIYEGYVYSEKTENLTNIKNNFEAINQSVSTTTNNESEEGIVINSTIKYILIAVMCLPILIVFLFLVFKRKSRVQNELMEMDNVNKDKTFEVDSLKKDKKSLVNKLEQLEGRSFKSKRKTLYSGLTEGFVKKQTIDVDFPKYQTVDDEDLL